MLFQCQNVSIATFSYKMLLNVVTISICYSDRLCVVGIIIADNNISLSGETPESWINQSSQRVEQPPHVPHVNLSGAILIKPGLQRQ